ncbi:MAG TPA: hypothetical protein VFZ34_28810 [Blastocatellia bacterium]|nr:hypothetical protein [Blastocatellia bacterium]
MQNANHHNEPDLNRALTAWEPPETPLALDQHVFTSYRQQVQRRSWWERFFTTSVRVPLPVLAVQVILLLFAGGGFVAFFTAQSEAVLPIVSSVPSREIIEVPIVTEKPVYRAAYRSPKLSYPRARKAAAPTTVLPPSAPMPPAPAFATEVIGWQARPELSAPKLHTEWSDAVLGIEPRPLLPVAASYPRIVTPEPLQTERLLPSFPNFEFATSPLKPKPFEERMSRTMARASEWVTKPLEKTNVIYRWIPSALPTVTSFVSPAKNACFNPFRSKPQLVDMQ